MISFEFALSNLNKYRTTYFVSLATLYLPKIVHLASTSSLSDLLPRLVMTLILSILNCKNFNSNWRTLIVNKRKKRVVILVPSIRLLKWGGLFFVFPIVVRTKTRRLHFQFGSGIISLHHILVLISWQASYYHPTLSKSFKRPEPGSQFTFAFVCYFYFHRSHLSARIKSLKKWGYLVWSVVAEAKDGSQSTLWTKLL